MFVGFFETRATVVATYLSVGIVAFIIINSISNKLIFLSKNAGNPLSIEINVDIKRVVYFLLIGYCVLFFQLFLNGLSVIEVFKNPLIARWAMGNNNGLIIQLIWFNIFILCSIVISFSSYSVFIRIGIVSVSLFPFLALSIRAPLIDYLLALIIISRIKKRKLGISLIKTLLFAGFGLLLVGFLGIFRLATQQNRDFSYYFSNLKNVFILIFELILQRLDYLDVLCAAEGKISKVALPSIPFVYSYIPRSLFPMKLFPTDTQVTLLAGGGFAEKNVTRIVGVVAEAMSFEFGIIYLIIWFSCFAFVFSMLNFWLKHGKIKYRGAVYYSRIASAFGALPLFGGWNTIYLSSFLLNAIISYALLFFIVPQRSFNKKSNKYSCE